MDGGKGSDTISGDDGADTIFGSEVTMLSRAMPAMTISMVAPMAIRSPGMPGLIRSLDRRVTMLSRAMPAMTISAVAPMAIRSRGMPGLIRSWIEGYDVISGDTGNDYIDGGADGYTWG